MKTLLICFAAGGFLAWACAPSFPRAVFTYSRHPDFSRNQYLSGRLGVFRPSYAPSYLVIAYRYLAGRPLSPLEQQQVREYWKDLNTGDWDKTATNWVQKWDSAMETQRTPEGSGSDRFDPTTNVYTFNCAEDAFRNAYQTWRARGARFGFRSAAVRSWVDAQQVVFRNCDAGSSLPEPASPELPELIRKDRQYQIAAAWMYQGKYLEAANGFSAIANDAQSPWHSLALSCRAVARAGGGQRRGTTPGG